MKQKERGFTLAELLVVIAIIGVLVAVSIPVFTAQLRKSRVAANQANARAAYAAAEAALLFEPDLPEYDKTWVGKNHASYCSFFYDVKTGQCVVIDPDNIPARWAEAGDEAWIDYYQNGQGTRLRTKMEDWKVDTMGDGNSNLKTKMGDKVFTRWKIDLFKGGSFDGKEYQLGQLSAICWKE